MSDQLTCGLERERERERVGEWVGGEWAVLWEPAWNGKKHRQEIAGEPQLPLESLQHLETERALICRNVSCPHHLGRSFESHILGWERRPSFVIFACRSICGHILASIDSQAYFTGENPEEGTQTPNYIIHNINEVLLSSCFHNSINKLFSEEIRYQNTVFGARKVAGSATNKQSQKVWTCVVL